VGSVSTLNAHPILQERRGLIFVDFYRIPSFQLRHSKRETKRSEVSDLEPRFGGNRRKRRTIASFRPKTPQEPNHRTVNYTHTPPSFPRTRESRLSTSEIVESLDSFLRGNGDRMDLTVSSQIFKGRRLQFFLEHRTLT
jgi:hypothetical protein